MTAVTFDTYVFIKKLKETGCSEQQAEVHADALKDAFKEYSANQKKQIATKQDLKDTETVLTLKIESGLADTKTELANTKAEIIKWVAGMLIAQVAVGATLIKILS